MKFVSIGYLSGFFVTNLYTSVPMPSGLYQVLHFEFRNMCTG